MEIIRVQPSGNNHTLVFDFMHNNRYSFADTKIFITRFYCAQDGEQSLESQDFIDTMP